jgi:hypothetical protein
MAHIYLAPFEQNDKMFFNISGNVGPNSPNNVVDVQLVQFGYFAMAQNLQNQIPDDLRAAAAAVVPGAFYDGSADDPLTLAIQADQSARGGVQDGHISVMRGHTTFYDSEHVYLLARLVNNMRVVFSSIFPRIDQHTKCPPDLKESVRRTFEVR